MITLGVDLAADPRRTAACAVDWGAGTIELHEPPVEDARLVELVAACDFAGLDVPLGWPEQFVRAVSGHHELAGWPSGLGGGSGQRDPLRYRVTDLRVRQEGLRPLSVSTDLIGVVALRVAHVLQLLQHAGVEVDRAGGGGRVAEVYPAGALARWNLTSRGYKGAANAEARRQLADALAAEAGDLGPEVHRALDGCTDHGLDAFVCACIAVAVVIRRTDAPEPEEREAAKREGWIHLPTGGLSDLVELARKR